MKRSLSAVLILSLLPACSHQAAERHESRPSAVVHRRVKNLGFKGLFASEGTQVVYTRAGMRREDDKFKFSGAVMKHLTKARETATIWRLDKDLQWKIDPKGKSYTECPLLGCRGKAQAGPAEDAPREAPRRDASCKMTVSKNRFTVTPKSETRSLSGFSNAKKYEVAWDIVAQDKDKKTSTSKVRIDIWTVPEDEARIAAVRAVERKFEEGLSAKLAGEARLAKLIPTEAMAVLGAQFLDGLSAEQRAAALDVGRELAKVRGFPLSTSLEWHLDGDACQAPRGEAPPEQEDRADLSSVGGFLGSLGSMAARKTVKNETKKMEGKPIFGFIQEVESIDVASASDGLFLVPAGFKRK